MATTTTNLGLTKPDYTDAADIAVINTNMDTVDTAITATKSDLGIVEDGNTATHSITAGQYVIWKGNLYTASSAIATGTTLSTSNLTAVSNGGLNSLNEQLTQKTITTPTLSLSDAVFASGAQFRKCANCAFLSFGIDIPAGTYSNNQVIGSGFPASASTISFIAVSKSGSAVQLNINSSGQLRFDAKQTIDGVNIFYASICYPV